MYVFLFFFCRINRNYFKILIIKAPLIWHSSMANTENDVRRLMEALTVSTADSQKYMAITEDYPAKLLYFLPCSSVAIFCFWDQSVLGFLTKYMRLSICKFCLTGYW